MADPVETFRTELYVLRDRVAQSIAKNNLGDLKGGLQLYEALIETVFAEFRTYEAVTGQAGLGLRSYYGQEMSWLQDDLRSFLQAVAAQPFSDVSQAVLGFLLRITARALELRELQAFGSLLRHFTFAWRAVRRAVAGDQWAGARNHLLLLLENLGDFFVGGGLRPGSADVPVVLNFARRLVAELASLLKLSVDDGSVDDLEAVIHTLMWTMNAAVSESERDEPEPTGSSDSVRSLDSLKQAVLLGTDAWVMLRHGEGQTDGKTAAALLAAVRGSGAMATWSTYLLAKDQATSQLLEWNWWESGLWRNKRGGFLAFDSFIDSAYVGGLLSGRSVLDLEVENDADTNTRFRLERLLVVVNDVPSGSSLLPGVDADAVAEQRLRDQLGLLISKVKQNEAEALIDRPLSPQRVTQFRDAVVRAWKSSQHLRALVKTSAWDERLEDESHSSAGPEGFGSNVLVPKEFFVDLENHYADQNEIGRSYGDGVARGEDGMIVDAVVRSLRSEQTDLHGLAARVVSAVDSLNAKGQRPTVLILNSWEMSSALRDLPIEPVGAWVTSDLESAPVLVGSGAPLLLRYVEGPDLCIVADFKAAVTLWQEPVPTELAGDELHESGWLLTGVEPFDDERALRMTKTSRQEESTAGATRSEADLARELRTQVQVRVIERVLAEVTDPTAGVIFRVEPR